MGKMKAHFMERMASDSEFRREVELAELALSEPDRWVDGREEDEKELEGRDQAKQTCVSNLF